MVDKIEKVSSFVPYSNEPQKQQDTERKKRTSAFSFKGSPIDHSLKSVASSLDCCRRQSLCPIIKEPRSLQIRSWGDPPKEYFFSMDAYFKSVEKGLLFINDEVQKERARTQSKVYWTNVKDTFRFCLNTLRKKTHDFLKKVRG